MADRRLNLDIPIRGEIDTAMPISDRPLGTLVAASDASPRVWGPRTGSKRFTGLWEAPGTASNYDGIALTTGATTYAVGYSFEDQFRDLGTQFTLDLWFRLGETAFAAGKNAIGLYSFSAISLVPVTYGTLAVYIMGPNVSDHERIKVELTTSPTRSTTDTLVSMTGTTRISVGSAQTNRHHLRLVRDGANMTLWLDGSQEVTSSSLVSTSGLLGPLGTAGVVSLGYNAVITDPNVTLKGAIYGAVLRDGVYNTSPIESWMPSSCRTKNIHHYYLNRVYTGGSDYHYFDAGPYGVHAYISGAGYTLSGANDNQPPAPSPVQGIGSWTTKSRRVATSVMGGGVLSTSYIS